MEPTAPERSRAAVEAAVREHRGRVLASLVGRVRDFELAEDALQDAVVAALEHWPRAGVPRHPEAWLRTAARRKAIDLLRRDARFRSKRDELEGLVRLEEQARRGAPEATPVDERLSLMFTCCHPALARPARVALTLRALGGLTTTEIAQAFLVPETTMAQRLVRARRKIQAARIPFRVPPPELWSERLDSVLSVIYFVFNEGYRATAGGALTRADLSEEAIRLGRLLVDLAPDEPEAAGLLALMLLHDSRRSARTDANGDLVPLERQDRGSWNRGQIDEGQRLLERALRQRRPGPYQLQAAISAVHASAPSHAATDWREIVALYRRLHELQPSWVVRLNEAVALSFAESAAAGLAALEALAPSEAEAAERYQPFHAARADLLRRLGRDDAAAAAYARAIELTDNAAEKRFLEGRRRELRVTRL